MRFEVLGPVRGWRGEDELELGSPQQRLLLAALLLARGRALSMAQLVDVLWGTRPPRQAVGTVQTYVSRLRAVLGREALASVDDGYLLRPAELDADAAEAALSRARDAGPEERVALLSGALALYGSEPLGGLSGEYAEAQRARLDALRLEARTLRLEAELALGRQDGAVAELAELCDANPGSERLTALLMRALCAAGRQAEAIGVYTDFRGSADVSAELAGLYQRIITGELSAARRPEPVGVVVPRQLPADVPDFCGRSREVAELLSGEAATLVVSAVSGVGGLGKTTLAVHVAHALADRYPDGQLFAHLRGAGKDPVQPAEVLGAFLRALGVAEPPDDVEERAALYRTVLSGRRVLVVLDDAADADQVRPLLPGSAGCGAIVTGRGRISGLPGARQVDLDVLEPGEALELLGRIAGEGRVAAEREAAIDLVESCGFLPLAIRIAGARLASRPGWTVARLRDRLADERRRLAELRVGDLAVAATFALSFDQLSPALARAFALLAVADVPYVTVEAAGAALGHAAADLCAALADLSLLESPSPGRYRYHDLVRAFARTCPAEEGEAALDRLAGFYGAAVANRFRELAPGDERAALVPTSGSQVLAHDEADAVLGLVGQFAGGDLYRLAWIMDLLADVVPESALFLRTLDRLVERAEAAGERAAEGIARICRSDLLSTEREVRFADAETALKLGLECGDTYLLGAAYTAIGGHAFYVGDYPRCEELIGQAVRVWRGRGARSAEARELATLARALAELGRQDEALRAARGAYAIQVEIHGDANSWAPYHLGRTLQLVGENAEARSLLEKGLAGFRAAERIDWVGITLIRLSELDLTEGDRAGAAELAEQALAVLAEDDEEWRGRALALLGRALTGPGRALACLRQAVEIFDRLDTPGTDDVRELLRASDPGPR